MPMTALPTPPSRQDPTSFAALADALMAALPGFVTEANALQADVSAKQTTASADALTAVAKAGEAAAARDIVMAVVNYTGVWSSLSGALAIPASVSHGGFIWMLTESVGNVAAEVPGVSSKWINVSPASGLGTAAYADTVDFEPAIGALTGLLIRAGGGAISAATAAQIVAAIGSVYVANATHATSADSADSATSIMDGSVNSAAKIANGIITWAKHAAMTTAKLIGRSTAGSGSPEEIVVGSGLSLSGGTLSCTNTTSLVLGTTVPSTSGTSIDFTGIPSWAKRITLLLNNVSTNGSSHLLLQVGSGSIQTTGYSGSADNGSASFTSGSGFGVVLGAATCQVSGAMRLSHMTGNIYVSDSVLGRSDTATVNRGGGVVALSGVLDRIRLTTVNGTDTFDSGSVNIFYEG